MPSRSVWDLVVIVSLVLISLILPYFFFDIGTITKTLLIFIWIILGVIIFFIIIKKSFFGFVAQRNMNLKKFANTDEAMEVIKTILYESGRIRGNEVVEKTIFSNKTKVITQDLEFGMPQYYWHTASGMPKVMFQADIKSPRMFGSYVFDIPLGYGIEHIKRWNFKSLRTNIYNYVPNEKKRPSSLPLDANERKLNMLANLPNADPDVISSAINNSVERTRDDVMNEEKPKDKFKKKKFKKKKNNFSKEMMEEFDDD